MTSMNVDFNFSAIKWVGGTTVQVLVDCNDKVVFILSNQSGEIILKPEYVEDIAAALSELENHYYELKEREL